MDLDDLRHQEQPELDGERLVADPGYLPLQPPGPFLQQAVQPGGDLPHGEGPPLLQHGPFRRARQRHELLERPYHVQRKEYLEEQGAHYVKDSIDFGDYVFAVTLPEPANEKEWRAIVKDPSKFVAKRVAKGVEVSYQRLNEEQRRAMKEAKHAEISEWLASRVCQAAVGPVPNDRLMRMRWVLTFKQADQPGLVKAKARLVVLGFTDPDYGAVAVRSPTLSRRGRQLLPQAGVHRHWQMLKADAKTAFLQGHASQQSRQIFGMPVKELQEAMNLPEGQAVQFLKAAYGITIAPREFYLYVHDILVKLGVERLKSEPCIWRLRALNPLTGRQETIGVVAAHVDDFLILGDESNAKWCKFIEDFHKSMKWSPWEVAPFQHCGVQLSQGASGNWTLSQREFCEGLNQVEEDGQGKDLTDNEIRQCRAVLGSAQWRVYQTAPHHAAKLSHLQSLLPKGDRSTLKEVNKFVRELYGQRDVTLEMHDLQADCDADLVAVGWSDAALANRVDLASTGGMIVGFVHCAQKDG